MHLFLNHFYSVLIFKLLQKTAFFNKNRPKTVPVLTGRK